MLEKKDGTVADLPLYCRKIVCIHKKRGTVADSSAVPPHITAFSSRKTNKHLINISNNFRYIDPIPKSAISGAKHLVKADRSSFV